MNEKVAIYYGSTLVVGEQSKASTENYMNERALEKKRRFDRIE